MQKNARKNVRPLLKISGISAGSEKRQSLSFSKRLAQNKQPIIDHTPESLLNHSVCAQKYVCFLELVLRAGDGGSYPRLLIGHG